MPRFPFSFSLFTFAPFRNSPLPSEPANNTFIVLRNSIHFLFWKIYTILFDQRYIQQQKLTYHFCQIVQPVKNLQKLKKKKNSLFYKIEKNFVRVLQLFSNNKSKDVISLIHSTHSVFCGEKKDKLKSSNKFKRERERKRKFLPER